VVEDAVQGKRASVANQRETEIERTERLIQEVLEIMPAYTPARGRFSSFPEHGYRARNPGAWQREFLEVLDGGILGRLKPDTNGIVELIELVNVWTGARPSLPTYGRPDGSPRLIPTSLLSTIVGYALLEMIVRKLLGSTRDNGTVVPYRKKASLEGLLRLFGDRCPIADLGKDLASLNSRMAYQEMGGTRDLYWRLGRGRDQLVHGNVLRPFEGEGHLLAPLIDLIVLHIQRHRLQSGQ
jgi:hypothetical protein